MSNHKRGRKPTWSGGLVFFALLRTVSGQGVLSTNSQGSATELPAINAWQEHLRTPGVLSTKPVLAALFCVTLLCLIWAGMMLKQKNLRRARHWLLAALLCVVVWGLAVLIVEAFAVP
jgi:hypothetical protein